MFKAITISWTKLIVPPQPTVILLSFLPSPLSPDVPCSGGQVYQECGRACGSSCSNLRQGWSCDDDGSGEMGISCVPGCQCPPGLMHDHQGQCVPINMCPCVQGDKTYQPGAVVQNNCNTWYVTVSRDITETFLVLSSHNMLRMYLLLLSLSFGSWWQILTTLAQREKYFF